MPDPTDPNLNALMVNLPPRLDMRELTRRVEEHIQVFRTSNHLLEQWLIMLRGRYRTRWDLQLLDDAKGILQKQIEVIDVGVTYRIKADTMRQRIEAGKLQEQTTLFNAQIAHDEAKAKAGARVKTAKLRAENEALEQEAVRAELRKRRVAAEKETRDLKGPTPQLQPERKPTEEEVLASLRSKGAHEARTSKAYEQGRLDGELSWREGMRRERDLKTTAVRTDPTLSEEEKLARIEEIEDAYADALARGA